ncbi:hypothetical protein WJ967_16805 [Achromobacter xylosoxidans]
MSILSSALLRLRLIARYAELRRSLERIVGSRDQASAALHETWLRLDTAKPASPVLNPDAYLLRMAARIATDDWRRNREPLGDDEREALLQVADETADPCAWWPRGGTCRRWRRPCRSCRRASAPFWRRRGSMACSTRRSPIASRFRWRW